MFNEARNNSKRVIGKPEQPGLAGTVLFLRILSRAPFWLCATAVYAYRLYFWIAGTCIE